MKDYVNLFYAILEKIDKWEILNKDKKIELMSDLMNIKEENDLMLNYFEKYRDYLRKNTLKIFTKELLDLKF